VTGIGGASRRPVVAEDIRDLQCRVRQARRALGGRLLPGLLFGHVLLGHQRSETIQRAHDLADRVGGDVRVKRRRIKFGVTEQDLNISVTTRARSPVAQKSLCPVDWSWQRISAPRPFHDVTSEAHPALSAATAKEPPGGPSWIHEIKHDGFRILAYRNSVLSGKIQGAVDAAAQQPARR
jgi:hypothetical protein